MTGVDLPLGSGRADFRLPDDVVWLDTAHHDVFCTASFFNLLPWIAADGYLAELGIERISAHHAALVRALRRQQRRADWLSPPGPGGPPTRRCYG